MMKKRKFSLASFAAAIPVNLILLVIALNQFDKDRQAAASAAASSGSSSH